MSIVVEYRVVDASTGKSPSTIVTSRAEAVETKRHREERWPEDGPQEIEMRVTSRTAWEAVKS